jgi:hypothetical protein
MKTMAFSAVILFSAGAMAMGSACSSSTTTTNNGTTDGSTDDTGSSSGGSSGGSSGSSSGATDSGGSCPWAEPNDAGTPLVPNPVDGGEDTGCEQCITGSCDAEWQCCFNDTSISMVETGADGSTTPAPSCYAYVACVQGDILSADAGVQTALTDCAGADGGAYPANSMMVGQGLLSCVVSKCATQCGL